LAVARSVGARLVISYIDNNSWANLFYFSNIRVVSIQNGWRSRQDFRNILAQDLYAGFHCSKPSALAARQEFGLSSFAIARMFLPRKGLRNNTLKPSYLKETKIPQKPRSGNPNLNYARLMTEHAGA